MNSQNNFDEYFQDDYMTPTQKSDKESVEIYSIEENKKVANNQVKDQENEMKLQANLLNSKSDQLKYDVQYLSDLNVSLKEENLVLSKKTDELKENLQELL